MSTLKKSIDFQKITHGEFEELCFELLLKHGFSKLLWRKGGADSGRDIEGELIINNSLIGEYKETFFFECKKYEKGVSPEVLNSKIAWADAELPDQLIFFISSYISNSCRTWIEKIESSKQYKIRIIEGDELKQIVSQHEDLMSKYFINDKYLNLLDETINKWLIHNLTPNFDTFEYLLNNLKLSNLSINQQVFLYTLYFTFYSKLEELENENYHGIDISEGLNELISNIKTHSNTKVPVLQVTDEIESLTDEGCLRYEDDNQKEYDFIASEIALYNRKNKSYRLTNYLFKRINENEAIELLIYRNSNLDYKIRYINNYNFEDYKESVDIISYKPKFANKIIENSINMR